MDHSITSDIPPPSHGLKYQISRREKDQSSLFLKRIQRILGPQNTSYKTVAIIVICFQCLLMLFMGLTIRHKSLVIRRLAMADETFSGTLNNCWNGNVAAYGSSQTQDKQQPQEALDEANYDDMAPDITGMKELKKYTSFFGYFLRCKPRPCDIDHWAYLGNKCFFRNKHVKDKVGHNATEWSLVQDGMYYNPNSDFPCPVEICLREWEKERNFTEEITLRTLQEHYKNDTPWNIQDMYTGNAYTRLNPLWGLEYKFHGSFSLTRKGENGEDVIVNKTGAITIRRGFTLKYCDVSLHVDVHPPDEPIYVIVPYTGRIEQLKLFYKNIKDLVDQGVSLRIILSTHGGALHVLGASELLREMQLGLSEGEFSDGHIIQVIEARGDREGNFSRSLALLDGLQYAPADALIFYCDVDMTILKPFFDNCRYNAHRNHQVYYPIVYSLYPYGYKVSKEHGYWRKGAFGMVCGYKSDFRRNAEWHVYADKLTGWGLEDVLLRRGFNNHWQISVFHAVEPNLLHRWHPKYCQFNANVAACLGTIFQNMGSQQFLASIVAAKGIDVRLVQYSPAPVAFESYKNASRPDSNGELTVPIAEGQTDTARLADLQGLYESALKDGRSGLLSIFAKEAQDALNLKETDLSKLPAAQNTSLANQTKPPSHDRIYVDDPRRRHHDSV